MKEKSIDTTTAKQSGDLLEELIPLILGFVNYLCFSNKTSML